MLIKSLSMKNFLCFAGGHDVNIFTFEEGLNLIVGTNGQGKSKIYDAFRWVVYDQMFNSTERRFEATRVVKDGLISDKAKHECNIGGKVRAEVTLVVTSHGGKEFRVTRVFEALKKSESEWDSRAESKLLIDEKKAVSWSLVDSSEHPSVLERIIPGHLSPYLWFQGEQVQELMDFTNSSTLSKAIELLSNVSDYDKIIDLISKESDAATRKYQAAQRRTSKDKDASTALERQRKTLEDKLASALQELADAKENLNLANENLEKLASRIDDAQGKEADKGKLQELNARIKRNSERLLKVQSDFPKKMFNDYWVLISARETLSKFSDAFGDYSHKHQEALNMATNQKVKLPINVPQPVYLEQMINDEKCFVCDRDAKKGSAPHAHMIGMLNRNEAPDPENIFRNDFSRYLKKLYDNQMHFGKLIDGTSDRISEASRSISELKSSIVDDERAQLEIESKFAGFVGDDDSARVASSFRQNRQNQDKYIEAVKNKEFDIDRLERGLGDVNEKIKKLSLGAIPREVELANEVFIDLKAIAQDTKKNVFRKLVDALELKSNELFEKMTSGTEAIKGIIRIKENSTGLYVPYLMGTDGLILNNPNESNIILQKLALIMAIIGARSGGVGNYSLISDAPTSKMDTEYTLGFYKTVKDQYKQSIIMTFNFSSEDDGNPFDELEIATLHKIRAHTPGGDKNDRADLRVEIRKIA